MKNEYALLTEKEEIWARMLMQVLEDNGIPCAGVPVYGAGLISKTGMQERLKVFAPSGVLPQAHALLEELFSAEPVFEE